MPAVYAKRIRAGTDDRAAVLTGVDHLDSGADSIRDSSGHGGVGLDQGSFLDRVGAVCRAVCMERGAVVDCAGDFGLGAMEGRGGRVDPWRVFPGRGIWGGD